MYFAKRTPTVSTTSCSPRAPKTVGSQAWPTSLTLLLALILGVATGTSEAWAGTALFDFESPGPDQIGDYETSAGVSLDGGQAALREQYAPPWHLAGWSYRMVVSVTNDTGQTLVEFPLKIDLEGAPDEVFDRPNLDGSDFVLIDANGNPVEPLWVERFDFIARRGTVWVQLDSLSPGNSPFYLYFGNPNATTTPGSAEPIFTYTTPVSSAVLLSPLAVNSSLVVESFVDNNQVELSPSDSWTLNTREQGTAPANAGTADSMISATGPYYAQFADSGTDTAAYLAYASQVFAYPATRYTDIFDVYAPFGQAVVEIYDDDTLVATETVSPATPLSITADVVDGHNSRVGSDLPVVVHRRTENSGNDYDAMPLLPPDTEIVGANSGSGRIVALQDNTTVDIYYSLPDHQTVTLDANQVYALSYGGSGGTGTGEAVHLRASAPVAGLSYGDGDGGEAVSFFPRHELGRRYLIPRAAEYVLISAVSPGVHCQLINPDGTVSAEETTDTIAPPYPNRLRFPSVAGGSELSCDAPVFAMMEDSITQQERNLVPIKAHRPALHPYPSGALTTGPQTRFAYDQGTVKTPTLEPADGMSALLSFRQTGNIWIPAGTRIRYQLSNNSGSTWYYHDGAGWTQAVLDSQSNEAYQVDAHSVSFPIESNQLTVKAFLDSEEGTESPVLDELSLIYAGPEEAVGFVFDTIDSTQVAGIPFRVTLSAVDANGLVAAGYEGSAKLSTYGGDAFPQTSPSFVEGSVTFDVAVSEVGEEVVLRAIDAPLTGDSNPFTVEAPDPSTLEIKMVEGDGQVGTVSSALAVNPTVQVLSLDTGYPVPGVEVTYLVTEGNGTADPPGLNGPNAEVTAVTDAGGLAQVIWTMGPVPGRNELQAQLSEAEGSPVVFEARADKVGQDPGKEEYWASSGGGCDCRAVSPSRALRTSSSEGSLPSPSSPWSPLWIFGLFGLLWLATRRFR